MDSDLQTICTMCGKPVKMSNIPQTVLDNVPSIKLKVEELAGGMERTYYLCPHCGFKYTVMLTDEEIRDLMKKRDKLKGYAKYKNPGVRSKKQKEYEEIDKEVKEKLNQLNGK